MSRPGPQKAANARQLQGGALSSPASALSPAVPAMTTAPLLLLPSPASLPLPSSAVESLIETESCSELGGAGKHRVRARRGAGRTLAAATARRLETARWPGELCLAR